MRSLLEATVQATVTSKGQVTIPKAVRDALGIEPGAVVDFRRNAEGEIVVAKGSDRKPSRFRKLLGTATRGLTTDEIMALTRGED